MWVHFETLHVNQQPTYASKYPPGQSLLLALGQTLFGHPWYGVLISVGLMCASFGWMLQGWLPRKYALVGSLLAILQFGVSSYWVNSYWGGALSATGGALVLGSLARLARRTSVSASLLGAFGIALLANTRPYEGLILTVACVGVLFWWRHKAGRPWVALFKARVILPAAIVLSATGIWMGYYNYRVTGKPWLMPYVVNQRAYAATPQFWMLPAGTPPTYRHEILRKFWVKGDGDPYLDARAHPLRLVIVLILVFLGSYTFPLLEFAAMALMLAPTRKVCIALAINGAVAAGLLLEKGLAPHYYAPVTGLILFLAASGARSVLKFFRGRSMRTLMKATLAGLFLIVFTIEIVNAASDLLSSQDRMKGGDFAGYAVSRRSIVDSLLRQGKRHLVIVKYEPDHHKAPEWVYNKADIDASDIVWARDMGYAGNSELINYYRDREAWLLEADAEPPRLSRYAIAPTQTPGAF